METSEVGSRFERHRRHLIGLAYRMLGSYAEAEDVVQDAFLRFQAADPASVLDARSYLSKTVARLCLDRLKSARAQRETYVGTWLPEPIIDDQGLSPDTARELADELSFALLLTLERLSPLERTAFLLHDVFDMDFPAVAEVLERSEPACRKLADRARAHVQEAQPRFERSPADEQRLVAAFIDATRSGDVDGFAKLLAEDAILYTDGGGKRRAALNPILGRARILRFLAGVSRKADAPVIRGMYPRQVNQLPGFMLDYGGGEFAMLALESHAGMITKVYLVSNPDKLTHLAPPTN
jgi:RNA polymerase sigma-70 factor (ECF subfamily)